MDWTTTHPSLLDRIRDPADAHAWREFDRSYGELIVRYARTRGLQHADAEEVRQAVLVNLSRAMPGFQYSPLKGRFRSYLGTAVRNAVSRFHRRKTCPGIGEGALSLLDDVDPADPVSNEPDAQWEREWTHHHCRLALASLRRTHDSGSVRVFERLLAGQEPAAVATEMGMTLDAVLKVRQRIRARLREIVAQQVREEDGG